jgi:signal transduction histidine kinase
MKVRSRLPMFAVAAALLGLIALLATLQYRWLGQVSAAERERMTANLAARASGFAQDFDREITRAYLTFQVDPLSDAANLSVHLGERYDRWQATSRDPRLVRDVYVVPRAGADAELQRFNASTRFIEPAEWPAALAPIRQQLAEPAPVVTTGGTVVVRASPPVTWESVPAIVVPAPMIFVNAVGPGAPSGPASGMHPAPRALSVVLVLDREYISGELLPSLVEQHFRGPGDGIDYAMAVVSSSAKSTVYSTGSGFTPDPAAASDAAADLFQVRLQDFGAMASEVRRFTSFISSRVESPGRGATVQSNRFQFRDAPLSILLQHGTGLQDRRAIETALTASASRPAPAPARWRLIVQHPAGSLETAVGDARRRNLLVSSGILGILGVSIGFLVVSTRRAQELARQQMEFVAAVSHELRTPLAVIRSAADNLAEGVVREDGQVRRYGELVRGEGRRLSEMVEQILELAGIQSGQRGFALAPVPVLPLLRDIIGASATLVDEAGMRVEYDVPEALPPVLGDEQALRRLFQNLVSNAIKYGQSGGWIGLRAHASGREVIVTVADRGAGIEPSDQPRIFEPFYRAPGVIAAQIHGAGLGLSLVQRIVEAHGGRIALRSAPGSGSEFTVHLPAATGEDVPRTTSVADPARTSA